MKGFEQVKSRPYEFIWVLVMDKQTAAAYKVQRGGELVVVDPAGKVLSRGASGKPEVIDKILDEGMTAYKTAIIWCESLAEAKEKAARDEKPIVVLVEDSKKQKTIEGKALESLHGKFVWAMIPYDKKSVDVKTLGAGKKGQIFVYDDKVLGTSDAEKAAEIKDFLSRCAEEKK